MSYRQEIVGVTFYWRELYYWSSVIFTDGIDSCIDLTLSLICRPIFRFIRIVYNRKSKVMLRSMSVVMSVHLLVWSVFLRYVVTNAFRQEREYISRVVFFLYEYLSVRSRRISARVTKFGTHELCAPQTLGPTGQRSMYCVLNKLNYHRTCVKLYTNIDQHCL